MSSRPLIGNDLGNLKNVRKLESPDRALPKITMSHQSPREANSGKRSNYETSPQQSLTVLKESPRSPGMPKSKRNTSLAVRTEAAAVASSMTVPRGNWKVSIAEMVSSTKKVNDEWGIKGYDYCKFNAHLDKPTVFSIAKESPNKQPRDYISMLQR